MEGGLHRKDQSKTIKEVLPRTAADCKGRGEAPRPHGLASAGQPTQLPKRGDGAGRLAPA